MSKVNDIRLAQKLEQQLRFIQKSCNAFDQGDEEEAIRIAVALRVIFHKEGSLVEQLRLLDKKILSSSRGHGNWKDYLAIELNLNSPEPVRMRPLLGDTFRELSVDNWWRKETVFAHEGVDYSRRSIILSVADKDGGAHVDKKLEPYYEVLSAGKYTDALSITGNLEYDGDPPFLQGVPQHAKNAHLALLRQFAYEVLTSVTHFAWMKGLPTS